MVSVEVANVPVSWVFTNGEATVRLDEVDGASVLHLVISGPGLQRKTHEFSEPRALDAYQRRCEARLWRRGYTLAAVIYDRPRQRALDA